MKVYSIYIYNTPYSLRRSGLTDNYIVMYRAYSKYVSSFTMLCVTHLRKSALKLFNWKYVSSFLDCLCVKTRSHRHDAHPHHHHQHCHHGFGDSSRGRSGDRARAFVMSAGGGAFSVQSGLSQLSLSIVLIYYLQYFRHLDFDSFPLAKSNKRLWGRINTRGCWKAPLGAEFRAESDIRGPEP